MFKKNLLFVLLFGLILGNIPSAYSIADLYNGRVKYGTYHCVKDGETCDFERHEGSSTSSGRACPEHISGEDYKAYNQKMADFLSSPYCQFTPTRVKKYECRYDVGYATVYMENGKVKSASFDPNMPKRDLQTFYEPDKCVEKPMEGDNGEPPLVRNNRQNSPGNNLSNNNLPNADSFNNNNIYYHQSLVEYTIEQSVKKETAPINEKIASLQKETDSLKKQVHSLEQYLQYLIAFLVVIFIISLIALIKSNNNPYNRL